MRVIKEEREDGEYEAFRDKDQHAEEKPVLERVKEEREEKCEVENKQQELYNSLNTETSAGCVKTEKKETTEDDSVVTCVHCGEVLNNISFLQSETHTEDHFTCHNCGKDFRGESHTDHLPNHTTAKKHQCPHCHKSFAYPYDLKRHIRTHTGEKRFICSQCGKSFSSFGNLKYHIRIHTGEKPFSCSQCGKSFTQKGHLNHHVKIHTVKSENNDKSCFLDKTEDDSVVPCVHCGETHTDKSNFTCHNCGKDFRAEGHKDKKHQCPHCDKTFASSSELKIHIRTHTGEKPFSCSQCGKSFSCSGNLSVHIRTHTGEKPFCCSQCGKSFSQNVSLICHMMTHTGESENNNKYFPSDKTTEDENMFTCVHCGETRTEDNFTCHNCGKDFRGESHTDHLPNHTTAKKHQCPHCHKSFAGFFGLKKHIRTHTGEKMFSCSHCEKSFKCSGNLSRHMRTHTGEKPFTCSQCGKSFSCSGNLNVHIRTHAGEKRFCCSQCGKSFSQNVGLSCHMRTHH